MSMMTSEAVCSKPTEDSISDNIRELTYCLEDMKVSVDRLNEYLFACNPSQCKHEDPKCLADHVRNTMTTATCVNATIREIMYGLGIRD